MALSRPNKKSVDFNKAAKIVKSMMYVFHVKVRPTLRKDGGHIWIHDDDWISINHAHKHPHIACFFLPFSQSIIRLKLKPICRVTFIIHIHASHANLWQSGWWWVTWEPSSIFLSFFLSFFFNNTTEKWKAIMYFSSFSNYNCDFQAFKLLILTNCPCKTPPLIVPKLPIFENELTGGGLKMFIACLTKHKRTIII
jgi:hypothetical protein